MLRRLLLFFLAAGLGSLAAQDPPTRVGRLSYLNGSVSFEPAGVTDWGPAALNRPLTIGDQLFVDNGGSAEIRTPGTAFRLGSKTAFQFLNLDDRTVQVKLSEGELNFRVSRLEGNLEIDTPNVAYTVGQPGEYRIDTNPDSLQTYVTVRAGEGQVTATGGSFVVHAGQQAIIQGQGESAQYQVYRAPGSDSFDNWATSRDREQDRYAHSQYVSPNVVGYEDMEQYGTWRSTPDYGQVWVPSAVAAGWAPYQDGSWQWVEPWGWTWVDAEPWGFAPFHYGRWAYVNGYWGWCPGPVAVAPIYAPALVAWVGFGGGVGVSIGGLFGGGIGVGWFPLGPRDVYVPAYGVSAAYVNRINVSDTKYVTNTTITNVYNNYTRTGNVPVTTYQNRTAPGAIMAVPQNALASARPVRQAAVKIQPNQVAAIKTAAPAPHVAPQVASVIGHAPSSSVARPPAAVLSRSVVAKATPPPPPPSFQQRQAVLAKNPGRPVPVAQLHQMAQRAPAAQRPAVSVVSHARTVTPKVVNAPAPKNLPAAAPATRAAVPPPQNPRAAQTRPYQPPSAQRAPQPAPKTAPPVQAQRGRPVTPQQRQTSHAAPPARSYEPPSAQRTPQPAPRAQPSVQARQTRPSAPPPAQPHVAQRRPAPQPHVAQQRPAPQPHVAQQQPAPQPHVAQQRPAPQPHVTQARPAPAPRPAPARAAPRGEAGRTAPPEKEHH